MQVTPKTDQFLHHKLPIDDDEKILAVYKHHWFAYASSWILGIFIVIVVMALAVVFTSLGGTDSGLAQHKAPIIAGAFAFCVVVLLGTFLPVYLRSQEELVLTEEALLQVLQPSLFASKVDQVGLQRIDDISVRQTFLGTILGFGHITVETPGEQDNFEFYVVPTPHQAAKEISQAHENFDAALNAGRLSTTLGTPQAAAAPPVDMAQYQQFLQYQQMIAAQTAAAQAPVTPASNPQTPSQPTAPEPQQSVVQPPPLPSYPPDDAAEQSDGAYQPPAGPGQ